MADYIVIEDVDVPHEFIKKHITFTIDNELKYQEFYEEFQRYFLRRVLSSGAFETICIFLNGDNVEKKELKHIINSLRRIFSNDEHYKGIIGEHLFAFYYHKMVKDLLWTHGPKGRSSAEPGIDFVTFTGDSTRKESIRVTIWETKTSEKSISSRGREIYDFFSVDGSFEENIDSEIMAIQERFLNSPDDALKEVVADLYNIVLNRTENLCIGACGVSTINNTTKHTFQGFADCFKGELTKEQRIVKFLFFKLLNKVMNDLRGNVWNKLQES